MGVFYPARRVTAELPVGDAPLAGALRLLGRDLREVRLSFPK
jgi:hypothetical protein